MLFFFFTVFGSEFLTWLGKHILHRSRPEAAVYTEHAFSFPSGHAASAIFTDDQLKFTETLIGARQEPLSLIIIANNDDQLIETFKKTGWI